MVALHNFNANPSHIFFSAKSLLAGPFWTIKCWDSIGKLLYSSNQIGADSQWTIFKNASNPESTQSTSQISQTTQSFQTTKSSQITQNSHTTQNSQGNQISTESSEYSLPEGVNTANAFSSKETSGSNNNG